MLLYAAAVRTRGTHNAAVPALQLRTRTLPTSHGTRPLGIYHLLASALHVVQSKAQKGRRRRRRNSMRDSDPRQHIHTVWLPTRMYPDSTFLTTVLFLLGVTKKWKFRIFDFRGARAAGCRRARKGARGVRCQQLQFVHDADADTDRVSENLDKRFKTSTVVSVRVAVERCTHAGVHNFTLESVRYVLRLCFDT